ncbi:MAG: DUF1552 domain-containing protein [Myxococcaceae bacterium]
MSKRDLSRRTVLRWAGLSLSLPLIAPHVARAQGLPRKRFIGVYTPNGAYMPAGVDGNWNFSEALSPLVAKNVHQNTMIVRGLFAGFPGADPHWQNCAGFLSCQPIQLGDPGVARCGVTLDQVVADAHPSPLRSLEVGGIYYHVHPLNDHPGYSNDYLNRISWQAVDKFRSPIADPRQMFARLFGGEAGTTAQINYLHDRKKSVLDQLGKDATRLSNRLPASYRPVLTSYLDTVREVEMGLNTVAPTCTPNLSAPTQDFTQANVNYVLRFQLMHQMVVLAMQCGLTNVATFMYGPGVSDLLSFPESLGAGAGHHAVAHHGGTQSSIDRLKLINQVQSGLFADLLDRLRTANLLDETLVLYGSDMSDGNVHLTENVPMVVAGGGSDLKLGQTIGVRTTRRSLADLHLEILHLLGVSQAAWGSGPMASTGAPIGLTV